MRIVYLFLLFLWSSSAFAGGGSSGVGMVAVGPGVQAQVANHSMIGTLGNALVDLSTGEKLIQIDQISKSALAGYGNHLVPSTLGQLSGYVYQPSLTNIIQQNNFWVICQGQESCLRLTPLSSKNPRVMDIVGGLQAMGLGRQNSTDK